MKDKLKKFTGSKPAPGDLALVQGFINTDDPDDKIDHIVTPRALRDWLADIALIDRATPVTEGDVAQARGVRGALRDLALANHGEPADPNALNTLNRAARSAQLAVKFEPGGGAALEPRAPGVDGAIGRILAAAFDAMAEGTWARLKVCPEETCLWAFFDQTKNRSGTWCSMSVCGNRTKARTYRKRHSHAAHMEKARTV